MAKKTLVTGPTFEEMLHPDTIDAKTREAAIKAHAEDPLDPINLYNITWRGPDGDIYYEVLPKELTGVEAPILAAHWVTQTPLFDPLPKATMRLATTRGTNALLERSGAPTVLFITAGFGDLLEIGNQENQALHDLPPDP